MKLLFCTECGDTFGLLTARRHCRCGRSSGRYLDDVVVEVSGPARVLCLDGNQVKAPRPVVEMEVPAGSDGEDTALVSCHPVDAWLLPEPHERVRRGR